MGNDQGGHAWRLESKALLLWLGGAKGKARLSVSQGSRAAGSSLPLLPVSTEVEPLERGHRVSSGLLRPHRGGASRRAWEGKRRARNPSGGSVWVDHSACRAGVKGGNRCISFLVALHLGGSIAPGEREPEEGAAKA